MDEVWADLDTFGVAGKGRRTPAPAPPHPEWRLSPLVGAGAVRGAAGP